MAPATIEVLESCCDEAVRFKAAADHISNRRIAVCALNARIIQAARRQQNQHDT